MLLGIVMIVAAIGVALVNLLVMPGGADVTLFVMCLGLLLLGMQRVLFTAKEEQD